ncbi:hypothetical protein AB0K09_27210 [Streptomyces sp. NPDC049577]|uniref:hypothetical protein n=1 Tax=Streptomyces sp. NPDC049577 TaxID=3155153 RepID=UPI0034193F0D
MFSGGSGEYTEATTHGTRLRGWKRSLLAAGAVFVLAMGTVTVVELASGSSADGSKGGTTVTRFFHQDEPEKQRDDTPSRTPGQDSSPGDGEERGGDGTTPSPGHSAEDGGGTGGRTPSPGPTPSGGTQPSPDATPSPGRSPDAGKGGGTDDGKGGGTTTGSGTGGKASPPPTPGQNAAAGTGSGASPAA